MPPNTPILPHPPAPDSLTENRVEGVPDQLEAELEGLRVNADGYRKSISEKEAHHAASTPALLRVISDEKRALKEITERITHLNIIKDKRTEAAKETVVTTKKK